MYVEQMTTPLLIIHSEEDLRCPMEQAEQLFTALKQLRRDVTFVRFPGENHELTRNGKPSHRVERFELLLDFFKDRMGLATPAREAELIAIFKEATRLETDFWDLGWRAGPGGEPAAVR